MVLIFVFRLVPANGYTGAKELLLNFAFDYSSFNLTISYEVYTTGNTCCTWHSQQQTALRREKSTEDYGLLASKCSESTML